MTSLQETADRLNQYIERIENLNAEKKGLAEDISDIFAQAKSVGFDVKAMRQVIKLRAMDKQTREELEQVTDTYKAALGM